MSYRNAVPLSRNAGLTTSASIEVEKGIKSNDASFPEKEEFKARIPLGRYGTVEEIAETAAFLVSDGAAYITGQNIRVDGGITRSV